MSLWQKVKSSPIFTISVFVFILWTIGQIFRDRTLSTALLFYIPSPYLLLILLGSSFLSFKKKKLIEFWICILLAVAPLFFIAKLENRFTAPPSQSASAGTTNSLRLVHWNIARLKGTLSHKRMMTVLSNYEADLYLLSEVPSGSTASEMSEPLGENYSALRLSSMTIAARGYLKTGMWLANNSWVKIYPITWTYNNRTLKIFIIDIASDLTKYRYPTLERIIDLVRKHKPDIIVGDFNAPRRSLALSSLPEGYQHAYDAAGRGWSYSWPTMPFAAMAIDQCIINQTITPLSYRMHTTHHSDHRLQILDFTHP